MKRTHREIGSGTYSNVFCPRRGDKHVVKCFKEDVDVAYLREVEFMLVLAHPHVAIVTGFTVVGPKRTPKLALKMKCYDKDLTCAVLPTLELYIQAKGLVAALEHMHAMDILHLDIKPDNILLDAETRTLVICDFGLAIRRPKGVNEVFDTRRRVSDPFKSPEIGPRFNPGLPSIGFWCVCKKHASSPLMGFVYANYTDLYALGITLDTVVRDTELHHEDLGYTALRLLRYTLTASDPTQRAATIKDNATCEDTNAARILRDAPYILPITAPLGIHLETKHATTVVFDMRSSPAKVLRVINEQDGWYDSLFDLCSTVLATRMDMPLSVLVVFSQLMYIGQGDKHSAPYLLVLMCIAVEYTTFCQSAEEAFEPLVVDKEMRREIYIKTGGKLEFNQNSVVEDINTPTDLQTLLHALWVGEKLTPRIGERLPLCDLLLRDFI